MKRSVTGQLAIGAHQRPARMATRSLESRTENTAGRPAKSISSRLIRTVVHVTLTQFTSIVIEGAAKGGKCVIIGRSSQCVLRHCANVLHVLVFAPPAEKVARMKPRHPDEHHPPGFLYRIDYARTHYEATPRPSLKCKGQRDKEQTQPALRKSRIA